MSDIVKTVTVTPFETTKDVVWTGGDGKPRCALHPGTCLVRASTLRSPFTSYPANAYVCARCLREAARSVSLPEPPETK